MAPGTPKMVREAGAKRVSAQHTLERVRNNQRRHRARRRDHVASLEKKVAEMSDTITGLRTQIDDLQRRHARCNSHGATLGAAWDTDSVTVSDNLGDGDSSPAVPAMRQGTPAVDSDAGSDRVLEAAVPTFSEHSETSSTLQNIETEDVTSIVPILQSDHRGFLNELTQTAISPPLQLGHIYHDLQPTPPSCTACCPAATTDAEVANPTTRYSHPQPAFASTQAISSYLATSDQATSLETYLPTTPGSTVGEATLLLPAGNFLLPFLDDLYSECSNAESTTLCSEAYVLIAQQNIKGLDEAELVRWLWSGFRRAVRSDEGCRVTTNVLFGLLAYISDP